MQLLQRRAYRQRSWHKPTCDDRGHATLPTYRGTFESKELLHFCPWGSKKNCRSPVNADGYSRQQSTEPFWRCSTTKKSFRGERERGGSGSYLMAKQTKRQRSPKSPYFYMELPVTTAVSWRTRLLFVPSRLVAMRREGVVTSHLTAPSCKPGSPSSLMQTTLYNDCHVFQCRLKSLVLLPCSPTEIDAYEGQVWLSDRLFTSNFAIKLSPSMSLTPQQSTCILTFGHIQGGKSFLILKRDTVQSSEWLLGEGAPWAGQLEFHKSFWSQRLASSVSNHCSHKEQGCCYQNDLICIWAPNLYRFPPGKFAVYAYFLRDYRDFWRLDDWTYDWTTIISPQSNVKYTWVLSISGILTVFWVRLSLKIS